MKLNLKEYTDPSEIAFHANGYINAWMFIQYIDRKDNLPLGISVEQEGEEHRDWLMENIPSLVPYLDKQISDYLQRPSDWIFDE